MKEKRGVSYMKKILVVDDEKPISEIVKYNLTKEGYEVFTAYDGEEAVEKVKEVEPDLIILDLMLPKMDGLEPFSNRELVARVKANLRRGATSAKEAESTTQSELTIGDLTIHPDAYMVSKRGGKIELTHREFELLFYLAKHIGQVMTREHLLQTVWGYDYFGDVRTVDVTVRRLREKIEDSPSHPTYLVTRRGVGYYLRNPEQE